MPAGKQVLQELISLVQLHQGTLDLGALGGDQLGPSRHACGGKGPDFGQRHAGALAYPDQSCPGEQFVVVDAVPTDRARRVQQSHVLPVPEHVGLDAEHGCGIADKSIVGHLLALYFRST